MVDEGAEKDRAASGSGRLAGGEEAHRRSSVGHFPAGLKWEFDEDVTEVFSDMLQRSIPAHDEMRDVVTRLSERLTRGIEQPSFVDLGSSRGSQLARIMDATDRRGHYVGVETSRPMLEASRKRFRSEIEAGTTQVLELDLRHDYPAVGADVTTSVLTLQFVPVEHRPRILAAMRRNTRVGAIVVEKVLGGTDDANRHLVGAYHEMKERNGYSRLEVERKRLALEGVLVPLSAVENERAFRAAGWRTVEPVWRHLNFAGWLLLP